MNTEKYIDYTEICQNKKYDMIVATDLNWGIGNKNGLLIHVKQDMKFFKKMTPNVVVMGRKTMESLPNKYLLNRKNVVISRSYEERITTELIVNNTTTLTRVNSIDNAIKYLSTFPYGTSIVIIGGRQIYLEFLQRDLIDRIFLTTYHKEFKKVDTYIPDLFTIGFKYDPTNLFHVVTGYESITKSLNNNVKFTIHTLVK